MIKILVITGLVLSLLGTIFLYLGSRDLPWDMQTISGKSDLENKFYMARKIETRIGLVFLSIGFLIQLIGAIKS